MTNTQARRWWNRQRVDRAAAEIERANLKAAELILQTAAPCNDSLSVQWAREIVEKAKLASSAQAATKT